MSDADDRPRLGMTPLERCRATEVTLHWPGGRTERLPAVHEKLAPELPELLEPFAEAIAGQLEPRIERCQVRGDRSGRVYCHVELDQQVAVEVLFCDWVPTAIDGVKDEVYWHAELEGYEAFTSSDGRPVAVARYRVRA